MSAQVDKGARLVLCGVVALALGSGGCLDHRPSAPTIAFIPQSAEGMRWEVERFGATVASEKAKCDISWSAPTSESDVNGQVSLINRVREGDSQGLVLAPNHPLAPLAPLRRVLEARIPVVVVSTALDLPANGKLGYIVNDDDKMGELAAEEIARLLDGNGSIALIGIARGAAGVMRRSHSAERFLASQYPDIRVVSRRGAAFSASTAQETMATVLARNPEVNAVLSFTANSTRGVHAALGSRAAWRNIHLVGCEQDAELLDYVRSGEIDAVVAENTYQMAYEAVEAITASWNGTPIPARSVIPPMLITKQSLDSAEARPFIDQLR